VAVVVVAANAIADGLYALIDPRVRRADDVPR
jgi:ABC-type dipeptide/oligopeptide/nickel transport system permease component